MTLFSALTMDEAFDFSADEAIRACEAAEAGDTEAALALNASAKVALALAKQLLEAEG